MGDNPAPENAGDNAALTDDIFYTEDGHPFTVTEEGSVGLLALGAAGLKAWRKVRIQAAQNKKREDNEREEGNEVCK